MKTPTGSSRTLVPFALMAVLLLPAARCGQSQTNSADIQGSSIQGSGPSSGIAVKANAGVVWSNGSQPPAGFAQPLVDMINGRRTGLGLSPLVWHDGLAQAVQTHNADQQNRGFLSIVNPDGVDLFNRLVSSSPRIDFDNAWAFVGLLANPPGGGNFAPIVYPAMLENTVTRALIESPHTTHIGVNGRVSGHFAMIFAANARP